MYSDRLQVRFIQGDDEKSNILSVAVFTSAEVVELVITSKDVGENQYNSEAISLDKEDVAVLVSALSNLLNG